MRNPGALPVAVVALSFLCSSCYAVKLGPVPEPEARAALDIRGVVVGECAPDGSGCETFEYSEVHGVQWSENAVTITGVVHAPGAADHGQISTGSFPLSDVSDVMVREFDGTRASVIVAAVLVGASVAITFSVTGKSKDGVPIGSLR